MKKMPAMGVGERAEIYLATEVEAHLAALQAQHAEALAERVRQRDAALHITYTLCEQLTRGHKSFCECDTCLHVNAAKEAMKP